MLRESTARARLPRRRADGRPRSVQLEQGMRRIGDVCDAAVLLRDRGRCRIRARRQRHRRWRLGGRPARSGSHARGGGRCAGHDSSPTRDSAMAVRARAAARLSHARAGTRRGRARLRGGLELRSQRARRGHGERSHPTAAKGVAAGRRSVGGGCVRPARGDDARARLHESSDATRLGARAHAGRSRRPDLRVVSRFPRGSNRGRGPRPRPAA